MNEQKRPLTDPDPAQRSVANALTVAALVATTATGVVIVAQYPRPAVVATVRSASRAPRVERAQIVGDKAISTVSVDRPRPEAPPPSSGAGLAKQVAAIDRARDALQAGDGALAQGLIDDYEARFPDGAFVQEAEVVRIEALLEQGDRVRAQLAAARFVADYPSTLHTAHVRALTE